MMYQQIGVFLVLLLCAGVGCLVLGWRERRDPTAPTRQRPRKGERVKISGTTQMLLAVGIVAGASVYYLRGWLFTPFLVPSLLVGLPYLLRRPEADHQIRRLSAMDEFGRASCRARVMRCVKAPVAGVAIKKQKHIKIKHR